MRPLRIKAFVAGHRQYGPVYLSAEARPLAPVNAVPGITPAGPSFQLSLTPMTDLLQMYRNGSAVISATNEVILNMTGQAPAAHSVVVSAPGFETVWLPSVMLPVPDGQVDPLRSSAGVEYFSGEVTLRMEREDYLIFNGRQLRWMRRRRELRTWTAVSGAEGYQDSAHQALQNLGPIPAGMYLGPTSELQDRIREQSLTRWMAGLVGGGTWPGNQASWGNFRLWLFPLVGTATHGRSGFTIHGGWFPGSAGCIDLVGGMDSFVEFFKSYGKSVTVLVAYGD